MRPQFLFTPLALIATACGGVEPPPTTAPEPAMPTAVSYTVTVQNGPAVEVARPGGVPAPQILILQTTHLDRPAEVVGVVDAHEEMGHHDAALDEMRRKAAALGADAVVGVEFHHGEWSGEPTRTSSPRCSPRSNAVRCRRASSPG